MLKELGHGRQGARHVEEVAAQVSQQGGASGRDRPQHRLHEAQALVFRQAKDGQDRSQIDATLASLFLCD